MLVRRGGRRFCLYNSGLQHHDVLIVDSPGVPSRVLLDPNELSVDGLVALTDWKVSDDGEYLAWLEAGGVYAVANLRGGGEYGREWHEAGMQKNRQKVFDDFIAAAEWLIDSKYTCRGKLAIRGSSSGGLLVGAAITQRPDLFAAAVAEVGLTDMLRYHRFTVGWAWVSEYGSPDDASQFRTLVRYSPLHNVKSGTKYPATLLTTAENDDRVHPAHSFKFAAALQHAQAGDAPILLRTEIQAGHDAGTPIAKRIDAAADSLAFLMSALK